jgi:general secretion pathway protein G
MVQRIRKVQNDRQDGFTLIELLIVIVVLGILAGIVVLGLGTFKQDAQAAACKADVKQVQTAVDAYIANDPANAAPLNVAALVPGLLKTAPTTPGIAWTAAGNVTATPAC